MAAQWAESDPTHTDVCISKGGQGDPEWRIHTSGWEDDDVEKQIIPRD